MQHSRASITGISTLFQVSSKSFHTVKHITAMTPLLVPMVCTSFFVTGSEFYLYILKEEEFDSAHGFRGFIPGCWLQGRTSIVDRHRQGNIPEENSQIQYPRLCLHDSAGHTQRCALLSHSLSRQNALLASLGSWALHCTCGFGPTA